MHIGEAVTEEIDEETLLGMTRDTKLSLKTLVESLCRKASQKLHAKILCRILIFVDSKRLN